MEPLLDLLRADDSVLRALVRSLVILLLALILNVIVRRATRRWVKRMESMPALDTRRQRMTTAANLVSSLFRYIVWPVAIIMVLAEFQVNIGPLVASAGIAGLAIGFGAQTLVRDVISGLFLLFDDTIRVGQMIQFGPDAGVVESIGVRLIRVRKFNGDTLMIPAGELRVFSNKSLGFMRAIVEVNVPYESDVDALLEILRHEADEWAEEFRAVMLEDAPTVQSVTQLGDSTVQLRVFVKVLPGEQFAAEHSLRKRLKLAFDKAGVPPPHQRRVMVTDVERAAGRPPSAASSDD
ncbi:MAG: mechanosensitive ion channel family protein [Bacteroidota bacterium]